MKCYKHPTEDAIGVCSSCGKGLCPKCAESSTEKLLCENCFVSLKTTAKIPTKTGRLLRLSSATLAWFAIIGIISVGTFLSSSLRSLTPYGASFATQTTIVFILTVTCSVMAIYGGHNLYKGFMLKGATINIISGVITTLLYLYFRFYFNILEQLGLLGYFLFIPTLTSGFLGVAASKKR